MNRLRPLSLVGGALLIIGVGIFVLTARSRPTDASTPFEAHSLAGMSNSEIGQYAVSWTKANDKITINGTPTVSVSRPMKSGDMKNFGDLSPANPSQYVIVLKGDFLVSLGAAGPTIATNAEPIHEKYLVEAFTQGGDLASFGGDLTGAYVKPILGDPSLPDMPQSNPSSTQTSGDYLKGLPAPLVDHLPDGSSRAGWATPPVPAGTSIP